MEIQILGTGCPKCKKLTEMAEQAARELGLEFTIRKVSDINEIMEFGVMSTPGLAVDGKVLTAGQLPTYERVKDLLSRL
ncbi:redox-active disulfide protein 2 [Thermanaerovibrio acidaminovorans DSM 6589]|uniref:Redox-active disulfide protein 2 n=1 Tax=Thermanaerovibrio acidaminovorans (strain ATCC 49978 / DSM 6589 / Su883) TaxID=525903 RepID=D1B813_THEAS|nr:thioredoxin family protein [Thermanaerovibrio acidaminovorans]ACZ18416.1 redox-active disulfide protein 2 [Thermanaerovibrio acidaminovorans DSM 6589]